LACTDAPFISGTLQNKNNKAKKAIAQISKTPASPIDLISKGRLNVTIKSQIYYVRPTTKELACRGTFLI
jgi:alpha-D-ribose 1-methylphosphonate 5-triphosphate diphosphatase PhnM